GGPAGPPYRRWWFIFRFAPGSGNDSVQTVIGTLLNVAGILVGGMIGLAGTKPLSLARQNFFKMILGVATVVCGLALTVVSFHGSFFQMVKQFTVVLVSLALGKFTGR